MTNKNKNLRLKEKFCHHAVVCHARYYFAGFRVVALLFIATLFSSIAIASDIPVKTIVLEAQGEGFDGMLAVAEVIRNRSIERKLTPEEVCLQRKQFSCWNNRSTSNFETSSEIWQTASRAWETCNIDNTQTTEGANLYYNPKRVKREPSWIYSSKVHYIKKIGNHVFYKEER